MFLLLYAYVNKSKVQFGVSQKNHFLLFYENNFSYLFTQSNAISQDLYNL